MLDIEIAGNSYLSKAAEHLRSQGEQPENWFSIQAEGKVILLPKAARKIIDEAMRANEASREAAITPAMRERWNIDGMFSKAERLRD